MALTTRSVAMRKAIRNCPCRRSMLVGIIDARGVDANESKIRKEVGAVRDALSREQQARDNELRKMAAQMEELAVGGLHLELVGLTWLVFGGLGTSIPDQIARLLRWLSAAV